MRNGDPKDAGYLSARILGSDFNTFRSSNCERSSSKFSFILGQIGEEGRGSKFSFAFIGDYVFLAIWHVDFFLFLYIRTFYGKVGLYRLLFG